MVDYNDLALGDVLIHQVPQARRGDEDSEPILFSDVPVVLNRENLRFLAGRLREALSTRARPVVQDPAIGTPVPGILRQILGGEDRLVSGSQEMASHLRSVQPGISSSGLLLVVKCKLSAEEAVIVAKVEHHQGMRVELELDANGMRSFNVTFLRDLIFGEGTRVFKIAAFLHSGLRPSGMVGEAADTQNGRGVAHYFLNQYLGCVFTERGDVLTQRFYESMNAVINDVADASKRAQYEIALLAELQKTKSTINPSQFLEEYIDPSDQDEFAGKLADRSVPMRQYSKDVTLIRTLITRMKIDTARNATILVPPDMYQDQSLTITEQGDGTSHVLVKDRINRVSGTGGPTPVDSERDDDKH